MKTLQIRCNVCNITGPHIALGIQREQDEEGWEFQRLKCANCGAHIRIDSKAVNYFEDMVAVADIMTAKVRTLTLDDSLRDAADLFQDSGIHHVPVTDPATKEVCGIVSDRDVLRAMPPKLPTETAEAADQSTIPASVSSIMTRELSHIPQTCSLADAIRLMREKLVDCLLVYDDPAQLEGILTSRDCMRTILAYLRVRVPNESTHENLRLVDMALGLSMDELFQRGVHTVEQVMSRSVFTLTTENNVQDAIKLMQAKQIRHIPIVNEHKHLLGIVSDRDILRALTSPLAGPAEKDQDGFRERLFATGATERTLGQGVGTVMSHEPITISPTTSFQVAIAMLVDKGISCLLIVDGDRYVSGIFTSADVLTATLGPLRFCHSPHVSWTGEARKTFLAGETGTAEVSGGSQSLDPSHP